ncbi:uncharacterized protein LOC117668003 isoform X2 [Pantherophis guttatus]|uniref:Uncharacterized protein LOC117668003 isoform X2 n=1 Tax=Pantherophis guttatus TaxID=94885 RepID=A0A6P9C276_PANGU|nr:uncharacterized protein LOC117668003 isoform X2 [Pantherophis guttatus]
MEAKALEAKPYLSLSRLTVYAVQEVRQAQRCNGAAGPAVMRWCGRSRGRAAGLAVSGAADPEVWRQSGRAAGPAVMRWGSSSAMGQQVWQRGGRSSRAAGPAARWQARRQVRQECEVGSRSGAFATMKEDNNFPKLFLIDEEANEFKLVYRSSYPKKVWGLFLQQSTMLGRNIKSGIKNTVSCVFHRYPLTLPSIKSVTLARCGGGVLVFLFLLFLLLKENRLVARYPFGYPKTAIVPIKEAVPKSLTVTNLLEAQKSEPFCEAMENCFDTAIKEFTLEPQMVKENAKMILECNGTRKEFVSGKGENYIEVFWVDGQTHYTVKEANSQVYVARLRRQSLPLSLASILNVDQQLASLEGSEELRQCLNEIIEEFPKEPHTVQDNAVLEVSCGGSNVTFRSGDGKNEINVYKDTQGKIVFNVKGRGWAWWARLFVKH